MAADEQLLASWNDTATRQAIVDFVDDVTTTGESFIPPAERIAVFDNDGQHQERLGHGVRRRNVTSPRT